VLRTPHAVRLAERTGKATIDAQASVSIVHRRVGQGKRPVRRRQGDSEKLRIFE